MRLNAAASSGITTLRSVLLPVAKGPVLRLKISAAEG